jgi:hypothetical protein
MAGGHKRSVLLGAGIALGALAGAVVPATLAGAANKTVLVHGTSVTVAKGWLAGKPSSGKLEITHKSPKGVIEIDTGTGVTSSPQAQGTLNFNSFTQGFGLKSPKMVGSQNSTIPGSGRFDEVWSVTYTGKYQGTTFGGLAAEFQNTKTGVACFAIVIAKQSDKPKLKNAVNQMFNAIAND